MGQKKPVTKRWEGKKTTETRDIEEAFRAKFPKTDAYRYNPVSIRVRVLDDRFDGKNRIAREKMVLPLLKKLPEPTQADITVLLLLAPQETEESLMNFEFEKPSPTRL